MELLLKRRNTNATKEAPNPKSLKSIVPRMKNSPRILSVGSFLSVGEKNELNPTTDVQQNGIAALHIEINTTREPNCW
jgi:hypothetical protein